MMIEFTLGMFAGFFLLPWYILAIIATVILVDVGYASNDSFVEATWTLFVGLLLVSMLGLFTDGFNPLLWAWSNPGSLITGFVAYAATGCLWCLAKWWLFLKKGHQKAEDSFVKNLRAWEKLNISTKAPVRRRPQDSYATNNVGRLTGWIFHWPFSLLGVIVGDIIVRFAELLQEALQGQFERMASSRFEGYED